MKYYTPPKIVLEIVQVFNPGCHRQKRRTFLERKSDECEEAHRSCSVRAFTPRVAGPGSHPGPRYTCTNPSLLGGLAVLFPQTLFKRRRIQSDREKLM